MWFTFLQPAPTVVVLQCSRPPVSDEEFKLFTTAFGNLYNTAEPFSMLIDLSELRGMPLRFVCAQASFMREHEAQTRRWVRRVDIVVGHPAVRRLLHVLFMLKPKVVPTFVHSV